MLPRYLGVEILPDLPFNSWVHWVRTSCADHRVTGDQKRAGYDQADTEMECVCGATTGGLSFVFPTWFAMLW